MIKLKKLVIVMIALIMSFSTIPTQVEAAQVKLNKTSVQVYVGKTAKLTVKNTSKKVKWLSSMKSIATVSKKGIVTAKKKGTCKITAKVGKKKYTCKVTVKQKVASTKNNYTSNSYSSNSSSGSTSYVYVTDTGSKYHTASCRFLAKSSYKITLSEAQSQGYTPCSVCH